MSYVRGQAVWVACGEVGIWRPGRIEEVLEQPRCPFANGQMYQVDVEGHHTLPEGFAYGACRCFLRPRDPMERNKTCWSDCAFQPKSRQRA